MMITIETIDAWKQCLQNPAQHGLKITPLQDFFSEAPTASSKEELAKQYMEHVSQVGGHLPKLILYIIMDSVFARFIAPDPQNLLGFRLTVKHPGQPAK